MEAIIYTRGVAKGDPGPAAIGVSVVDETGSTLDEFGETIGNSSDLYAAYYAVLRGLQVVADLYADQTKDKKFEIRLDNELVKEQLNDEKTVTNPGLVPLFMEIHNLRVTYFPHLTITQVSDEENEAADRLVRKALDR